MVYSDLFSYYSEKICFFCLKKPKTSGICLLCGDYLCNSNSGCDSMQNHRSNCASSITLLMDIQATYVYLLRNDQCAIWSTLYLDEHGEEDINLK